MQELEMISHFGQLPWNNLEGTSQTQMVNNCFLYAHSSLAITNTFFKIPSPGTHGKPTNIRGNLSCHQICEIRKNTRAQFHNAVYWSQLTANSQCSLRLVSPRALASL